MQVNNLEIEFQFTSTISKGETYVELKVDMCEKVGEFLSGDYLDVLVNNSGDLGVVIVTGTDKPGSRLQNDDLVTANIAFVNSEQLHHLDS